MRNSIRKISSVVFLLFALFYGDVVAQQVSFETAVSRKKVEVGGQLKVTFTLYYAQGKDFDPPDFDGFHVLSGPQVSNTMQFINGVSTRSVSYIYVLQPVKEGKFVIGPAYVVANGTQMRSNPVTIEVVKNNPKKNKGKNSGGDVADNIEEHIFLRAIVDKSKVYQGEQITVLYKLYTKIDIIDMKISKSPAYIGFWSQDIELPGKKRPYQETINDVPYTVVEIKQVALFPQRSGKLDIEPMEAEFVARIRVNKRRSAFDDLFNNPFFGFSSTKNVSVNVVANKIKVEVKSLPSYGKPASFNGIVGKFNIQTSLDKEETKTNEAVTLRIKISGSGNVKLLDLPELELPQTIETYEPKITDYVSKKKKIISGSKSFEYLLIPRHEGKHNIQPIEFTYFDPSREKYVTVTTQEYFINATPGDEVVMSGAVSGFSKEELELLGEDIRFIKSNDVSFHRQESPFFGSPKFYGLALFPMLLFVGFVFYWKKHERSASNSSLVKSSHAKKLAKKHLSIAGKYLKSNERDKFYEEISRALWGYVGDRLTISGSELSKDLIEERLLSLEINKEVVQELIGTLNKCEMSRFSPSESSGEMKEMYNESIRLISEIESQLKV